MSTFSVVTDNPVPSCVIQNLLWDEDNKRWSYEYYVTIPNKIEIDEDGKFSKDLYVYGHIQELKLVDTVTKNSINISVKSVDDIKRMIDVQYKADIEYRNQWIENNPDYIDNVFTIQVENKTQYSEYNHIISIKEQNEDHTVFIAAPQKGRVKK